MKKIYIKYADEDITPIEKISIGDWIDLRAAETVSLKKGESKLISLGVAMQLPRGYEAHLAPRSSTYSNWNVLQTNSVGVIDNSYCGDSDIWCVRVVADENTVIQRNDRICQFRIMKKQPKLKFITVDKLGNKNRGGFGSTGKR